MNNAGKQVPPLTRSVVPLMDASSEVTCTVGRSTFSLRRSTQALSRTPGSSRASTGPPAAAASEFLSSHEAFRISSSHRRSVHVMPCPHAHDTNEDNVRGQSRDPRLPDPGFRLRSTTDPQSVLDSGELAWLSWQNESWCVLPPISSTCVVGTCIGNPRGDLAGGRVPPPRSRRARRPLPDLRRRPRAVGGSLHPCCPRHRVPSTSRQDSRLDPYSFDPAVDLRTPTRVCDAVR